MTPDELKALIAEARSLSPEGRTMFTSHERMMHRLADALEAALSAHPAEETEWTTEPDITWPGDLHPRSRVRASRELIREANAVRDLDGTGIVGRLADMLAGWLPVPTNDNADGEGA